MGYTSIVLLVFVMVVCTYILLARPPADPKIMMGAMIALFTVEQLVNGCRKGFDHPEQLQ